MQCTWSIQPSFSLHEVVLQPFYPIFDGWCSFKSRISLLHVAHDVRHYRCSSPPRVSGWMAQANWRAMPLELGRQRHCVAWKVPKKHPLRSIAWRCLGCNMDIFFVGFCWGGVEDERKRYIGCSLFSIVWQFIYRQCLFLIARVISSKIILCFHHGRWVIQWFETFARKWWHFSVWCLKCVVYDDWLGLTLCSVFIGS